MVADACRRDGWGGERPRADGRTSRRGDGSGRAEKSAHSSHDADGRGRSAWRRMSAWHWTYLSEVGLLLSEIVGLLMLLVA